MGSEAVNRLLKAFQSGESNFDQISIKAADLQAKFLPFVSLKKANLTRADLRHSILPGSNFYGALLTQANFEHANLLAVDMSWADLTQANLSHALIAGSTLVGANLSSANLVGASLAHVDLSSANLRNANLKGANLKGANLRKANLFGARIDPHALADAVLEFTVMPDGECYTQLTKGTNAPVPMSNLMSYTRLAKALHPQRVESLPTQAVDESKPATAAGSPQTESPVATPANSPRKTGGKYIWFQFAEQSGDLDLAIVNPTLEQDLVDS